MVSPQRTDDAVYIYSDINIQQCVYSATYATCPVEINVVCNVLNRLRSLEDNNVTLTHGMIFL
jgi:hypothetical protein